MLQILPDGIPSIYLHGFNLYFAVGIGLLIILLGVLLLKKPTSSDVNEFFLKIKRAYGIFLIFYGTCRIFFILGVQFPDQIDIFGNTIENGYKFFILIGYLLLASGLLAILSVLERYIIKKTKHVFSIVSLISIIIGLVGLLVTIIGINININFSDIITYYLTPVMIALILLIYVSIAAKTSATTRRRAIIIIIAIALLGSGAYFDSEGFIIQAVDWLNGNVLYLDIFYCIPPLISFIGTLLFTLVNLKHGSD